MFPLIVGQSSPNSIEHVQKVHHGGTGDRTWISLQATSRGRKGILIAVNRCASLAILLNVVFSSNRLLESAKIIHFCVVRGV